MVEHTQEFELTELTENDRVEATRLIADSLDSHRKLSISGFALDKITSVEYIDRTILVSGSLKDARSIFFRYNIDDSPTIVPTIQLFGDSA